jgi:hypothetical protein
VTFDRQTCVAAIHSLLSTTNSDYWTSGVISISAIVGLRNDTARLVKLFQEALGEIDRLAIEKRSPGGSQRIELAARALQAARCWSRSEYELSRPGTDLQLCVCGDEAFRDCPIPAAARALSKVLDAPDVACATEDLALLREAADRREAAGAKELRGILDRF